MADWAHPCLSSPDSNFWVLSTAGNWGLGGENKGSMRITSMMFQLRWKRGGAKLQAFIPCSNFPASSENQANLDCLEIICRHYKTCGERGGDYLGGG